VALERELNNRCSFPDLPPPYDKALRDVVSFVMEEFKPVGIIASGTIIRGNPDPASDLDIWVIHLEPVRQRLQKFFNGIPAEIFVNPPWVIETYFTQDQANARPISAHIMATGFVVYNSDSVVDELLQKAVRLLTEPPALTEETLIAERYRAATRFEDALDMLAKDPIAANACMSVAVMEIVRYAFLKANRFVPRDKDLLAELESLDPETAVRVRKIFSGGSWKERFALATDVADRVLEVRGFFEWNSKAERKEDPSRKKPRA